MFTPGRWDVQIFRGADLNLDHFRTIEDAGIELRDGKRWVILRFVEGGQFEGLCPRGVWVEPERH